jgi:hypothetical protein
MYAKNVIHELSRKKQHKVKPVTLSTISKTMVERFEWLQMVFIRQLMGGAPQPLPYQNV